jgi:hypothetical protein
MATRATNNGKGSKAAKTRYWISFDLGLMGDYSRVYEWLDSMDALECGPGVAMKQGGRFVAGGRKAAPWEGFAVSTASVVDES